MKLHHIRGKTMRFFAWCLVAVAILVTSTPVAGGFIAGVNDTTLFVNDGTSTTTTLLSDVISAPFTLLGRSVAFDPSGSLLINTNAGLFKTTLGSGVFSNTNAWGTTQGITDVSATSSLLAGINSTTLFLHDGVSTTTTELGDVISAPFTLLGRSVAFEQSGSLLVNTNAGLFRTTPGSGVFTNTNAWGTTQGITQISVSDGGLIAGVNTTTLFLFDGSSTTTIKLGDVVSAPFTLLGRSVAFEPTGSLLVNTNAGLYRTTPGSGVFTNTNAWPQLQGIKDIAATPIPEPSTFCLLGSGIAVVLAVRRRRRSRIQAES